MIIYNDFKEFIKLLTKYEVNYLIVSGYAVSLYARPRYTDDIDFWIEANETNAPKMLKVLKEFGFGDLDITIQDLTRKDFVIQLGQPPVRIDIIKSVSGVEFDDAFKKREIRAVPGVGDVYFISYQHLIENKTKSNIRKDIDALNWIKEYGKSSA